MATQKKRGLGAPTVLSIGAIVIVATVLTWMLERPLVPVVDVDGTPLPFFVSSDTSDLTGSATDLGTRGGTRLREVSFDNGEVSEVLQGAQHKDSIDFVLTPGSGTISHGAKLSDALTPSKKIFGYKYKTRDAALEKQRRTEAANGQSMSFSQLFPGEFFVSGEQRAFDQYITRYETTYKITFRPLSQVKLEKNARYIIIENDPGVTFTARGLQWCGDGAKQADRGEVCDDGNDASSDGCSSVCAIESGFTCTGSPSVCTQAAICGNGVVTAGTEECDDGNTSPLKDGCDANCKIEVGFSCQGAPSTCATVCGDNICVGNEGFSDIQCSSSSSGNVQSSRSGSQNSMCGNPRYCPADCAVCGNFIREGNEECDDGNQTNADQCTNACKNPACGDGFIVNEGCDDANKVSGDGCSGACTNEAGFFCSGSPSVCTRIVCGDGNRQGTEPCDDGNQSNTDACTVECKDAVCGDRHHQPKGKDGVAGTSDDEDCDDGNRVDNDSCNNTCQLVASPF